jgi:hypothetical protein
MKYAARCTLQAIPRNSDIIIDMCQFDSDVGSNPILIEAESQEEADEKWAKRCIIEAMTGGAEQVRKDYQKGKWK